MSITWILVANARRARLFANHGPNKGLALENESIAEEQHEIQDERHSAGRASPKKGTPMRQEARSFAHRLADILQKGRSRGDFERVVLVAPPSFMGMLNAELDGPTASLVSGRLDKDYTRVALDQLNSELGQCVCV